MLRKKLAKSFQQECMGIDYEQEAREISIQFGDDVEVAFEDINRPIICLTGREAKCLCMIMQGNSFAQAADRLGLSVRTVELYFNNIKRKTQMSTISGVIATFAASDFLAKFTA